MTFQFNIIYRLHNYHVFFSPRMHEFSKKLFGGTWTWWFSSVESPPGVSPVDLRVPGAAIDSSIFPLRMAGFCRGADDKSLGWMVDQGVWRMKLSDYQWTRMMFFVKCMVRKCSFQANSMDFFPAFWWLMCPPIKKVSETSLPSCITADAVMHDRRAGLDYPIFWMGH